MDIAPALSPLLLAGAVVTLSLGVWGIVFSRVAVYLLCISLIAGQVLRIPLPGQGGGILLSDVAVVLVLLAAVFTAVRMHVRGLRASRVSIVLFASALPFILWALFTLVVRAGSMPDSHFFIAALYWVRTSSYLLLLPALHLLSVHHDIRNHLRIALMLAVGILSVFGLVQLMVLDDLSVLTVYGWDPHQGRVVSTWLDPNFFGGFLVVALPIIAAYWKRGRVLYGALVLSALLALAGTQSRSALLALVGVLVVYAPALAVFVGRARTGVRRLVVGSAFSALVVWGVFAGVLLGDRLVGFIQPYDPTVVLRTSALELAWERIVEPNVLVGVGYNAYQFATASAGLIGDFSIHSRAGADNSWLTIWATTGVVGVALFALPWVVSGFILMRQLWQRFDWVFLAGLASLGALVIHSQVVNSFLYAHLLITMSIVLVVALTHDVEGV